MKLWMKIGVSAVVTAGLFAFHQFEFASDKLESPLPAITLAEAAAPAPAVILAWVGSSKAFRWDGAAWQPDERQAYEFTVLQRRFTDHWDSVKVMHRRHPDYDGSAGNRDQVHYFRVDTKPFESGTVPLSFASSMGAGTGQSDLEFRNFDFKLKIDAPAVARWFMPFDTMNFKQNYDYEAGNLNEEIVLVKVADGQEKPAFKFVESAKLLTETKLAGPPTLAQ